MLIGHIMVEYDRIIGTLFCGSASIAQGASSVSYLTKYFDHQKNYLEIAITQIEGLPEALYETGVETIVSLGHNPDLYHGVYMGAASIIFAGITAYFALRKPD